MNVAFPVNNYDIVVDMMPPVCALCDRDIGPDDQEGGLVSFRLTKEQEAANERFKQSGFTGHPDGLHWFCGEHRAKAQDLSREHDAEAFRLMRIHFGMRQPEQDAREYILERMRAAEQVTLESNKEYFSHMYYKAGNFWYAHGETIIPDLLETEHLPEEQALELLRNKIKNVARNTYKIELTTDRQVMQFIMAYPFWVS